MTGETKFAETKTAETKTGEAMTAEGTTRGLWNALMAALWLSLPAIGLRYWLVWDQLPARMASHFNPAGRANGWMPREVPLAFSVGFLVFLISIFTVVLYAIHKKYAVGTVSWALLAFFHLEIWSMVFMLNSTLDYNLYGKPIVTAPTLVITPIGVLALVAIALTEKCGASLPPGEVIAEEVHAGKAWSAVLLVPLIAAVAAFAAVSNLSMRFGAGMLFLLFIGVFGLAWDGFHYYFTRYGIEIRSLGFRLKSIPLGEIKQYAAESWNPIGGYGIRGMGNRKAYVWGNKGVRIKTDDGEVFLGHSQPDRIVHDLDLIRQFAH
jgi:hypothetical protein